jgi:hypothetical protein
LKRTIGMKGIQLVGVNNVSESMEELF